MVTIDQFFCIPGCSCPIFFISVVYSILSSLSDRMQVILKLKDNLIFHTVQFFLGHNWVFADSLLMLGFVYWVPTGLNLEAAVWWMSVQIFYIAHKFGHNFVMLSHLVHELHKIHGNKLKWSWVWFLHLTLNPVYDTLNCTEVFLSFFCIILILVCLIPEVARSMEGVSYCGHNHKLSCQGVTTTL
jgi:hypothetical protein